MVSKTPQMQHFLAIPARNSPFLCFFAAIRADRAQGAVRNIEINLTLLQPFGELSCLIDGDTKENALNEQTN